MRPGSARDDLLDRAWGSEAHSRLSCQTIVAGEDLTIEIPNEAAHENVHSPPIDETSR